ncbi:MAG: homoserine kinase [Chloroflexi bacterium]|nr:homoserine kinase [Chloroflexota bacterium]
MIRIHVPATSANLGPGFDAMGIALDLWNTFELREDPAVQGIAVETRGEGAGVLAADSGHLVVRTMLEELSLHAPFDVRSAHYRVICTNAVPVGSGLGSSSTATLAGLMLARHLLEPASLNSAAGRQRILARACEIEGHGDNVAPALLGGLVVVAMRDGQPVAENIPMVPTTVTVCVPQLHFLTSHARAVLPATYSRADAVFNIGRAALVVEALRRGDLALLARVMEDRIHEPYRMPAIPGAMQARQAALSAGAIAVAMSGAGPGLIAFSADRHAQIGEAMVQTFAEFGLTARAWTLQTTEQGAWMGE